MHQRTSLLSSLLLLVAAFFLLGCSQGGGLGCRGASPGKGGASEASGPKEVSSLVGVYRVTRYQQSEGTCDQLVDVLEVPNHLVLYYFEPNDGTATRLGGAFCSEPNLCRAVGERAAEPPIGYSFISGDDASGWQGWAIGKTGSIEKKCVASVQSHFLTSPASGTIQIETKTMEVVFEPASEEGGAAACRNRDAIAAVSQDQSCKSRLVLQAKRVADQ